MITTKTDKKKLADDIRSGVLNRINSEFITNKYEFECTEINITKPLLIEDTDSISFGAAWMYNCGNVGTIKITRSHVDTATGIMEKLRHYVMVLYIDNANNAETRKNRFDDF